MTRTDNVSERTYVCVWKFVSRFSKYILGDLVHRGNKEGGRGGVGNEEGEEGGL